MKDNYHLCLAVDQMVPFLPVGLKDKKRKYINKPATENIPMRSWGETPDVYDDSMGAPTRGRR